MFWIPRALGLMSLCLRICGASEDIYNLVDANLCINGDFIETKSNLQDIFYCSVMCSGNPRCQAFTMADGPCQLFVFDKCSKSVRICGCSRRGQVFVKQRPGLEAGALCPSGYGMEQCGVKYRLYTGIGYWWPSRQKCESESGLVIMADVTSVSEMSHVDSICSNFSVGRTVWLGGYQPAGSPEPAGGWLWVGCNISFSSFVWRSGEPNNAGSTENKVIRYPGQTKLLDASERFNAFDVLCECVSPFD